MAFISSAPILQSHPSITSAPVSGPRYLNHLCMTAASNTTNTTNTSHAAAFQQKYESYLKQTQQYANDLQSSSSSSSSKTPGMRQRAKLSSVSLTTTATESTNLNALDKVSYAQVRPQFLRLLDVHKQSIKKMKEEASLESQFAQTLSARQMSDSMDAPRMDVMTLHTYRIHDEGQEEVNIAEF